MLRLLTGKGVGLYENAWFSGCCTKQVAIQVSDDTGRVDIFIQEVIEVMVTGNVMLLAVLLVQPDPSAAALHEIIADLHLNDGADAGETVDVVFN